ncbi:unnamed protein product [Rotaria sp. Silwood2]|nr:unnamed protein product [Rotaria sp. Silwood2]
MRKRTPAGIAAAEIDDMTIHSFLGEQRNFGEPQTIKPGDAKLEKEWRSIEYLLIAEMSMVGLTLLAKHSDPQVSFGGVTIIFFGDYLQYRSVYDALVHTDLTLAPKTKPRKRPTEKEIQQRVVRSLILQSNCVVKLTQQIRTEDLRYLQLLERLRHGKCNYDDYELLLTRVMISYLCLIWVSILVFRNEVRMQLNHKAAIHDAAQLCYTPMTKHLPGLLPFVPGMPVILTQNIAIKLGLINGINGIFRQLVYQSDSVSTNSLSEAFPSGTRYVHRPVYALIEITKAKIGCNLEALHPKLVPVLLMEQIFRVDIGDILPNDRKQKLNQTAILSIKRRALPLVSAYLITTHKSQGQSLNKVVIDLRLPNETDDIAAIYVPLSRVKRLIDLVILRHFDYKVLLIKLNQSQLAEMERPDKL